MKLSVLMSVWAGEDPSFLRDSLRSLAAQTLRPAEVVLVEDGPLPPALPKAAKAGVGRLTLRRVPLRARGGLGPALQAGLLKCRHEWVARMDTDDLARPQRLRLQADFLDRHPDLSVLGGWISEFEGSPQGPTAVRKVPPGPEAVASFARFRNPMNHMTVLFRRSHVLAVGGYRDFPWFEDYDLWLRLLAKGHRLANLPEVLVDARFNEGSLARRRGLAYALQEWRLYRQMLSLGLTGPLGFLAIALPRMALRSLPRPLLEGAYGLLRTRKEA